MDTPAVTAWHPGIVLPKDQLTPDLCASIKFALNDEQALALTCFGEARSRFEHGKGWVPNPVEALADVANVVANRLADPRWSKYGIKGICHQRRQYSCWDTLGGPDNFFTLMNRAQRLLAGELPDELLSSLAVAHALDVLVDTLGQATHYFAHDAIDPPVWAVPPAYETERRFGHSFWAHVR